MDVPQRVRPGADADHPTLGAHEQIYVDDDVARSLVLFGLIIYDVDYGPNARVYRPVGSVSAEEVKSWLT